MSSTTRSLPTRFVVVAVFALATIAGCRAPISTITGCTQDAECGVSQRCDTLSGQCLCTDDNGCDASEFCNVVGKCQTALECLNNSDCETSEFCDTLSGECIARVGGVCVLDSQCPFGSFCGQNRGCATGCRDDGDCILGTPCIDGSCDETPGACTSAAFCEFGQLCASNNRCVDHVARRTLCEDCSGSNGFSCADECLIDGSVAPTSCTNDSQCARGSCEPQRCAVDTDCNSGRCGPLTGTCITSRVCQGAFCGASGCDDQNPCPRGYTCGQLQVVSGTQCTLGAANQCGGGGRACNGGGENGAVGFCSCAVDSDCPSSGFGGDATVCANPGPNGACIIGTTCAPADGLLCEDLR